MKKNKLLYIISSVILFVAILFAVFYFLGFSEAKKQKQVNSINFSNIDYVYNYIIKNFNGDYPFPYGDLILLDNDFKQIHLEDRNSSLEEIDNLYIIQGNTCGIKTDSSEFISKNYDVRFSTGENKKCFSYAVTKDRKHFQLGAVVDKGGTYVALLTGNSENSITRDIASNNMVENGNNQFLPYSPTLNTKFQIKLERGNGELLINEDGSDLGSFDISDQGLKSLKKEYKENISQGYFLLPILNTSTDLNLTFSGEDFVYKIIYPNGNIQIVSPINGLANLQIKGINFSKPNTSLTIFNLMGKIAYNFVKLSPDSNYELYDNKGSVLTVRGTQFGLEVDDNMSSMMIFTGKIDFRNQLNNYILDNKNSLIGIDMENNYVDLIKKLDSVGNVAGINIALNILLNKKTDFKIQKSDTIITGSALSVLFSTNKDLKLLDINNFESNKEKYVYLDFDGYFDTGFAVFLVENRLNIQLLLNAICKQNSFGELINLDDAYKILSLKDEKTDFGINSDISSLANVDIIIPFMTRFDLKDNANLFFYDGKNQQVSLKNISSYNNDDKRTGVGIICKIK